MAPSSSQKGWGKKESQGGKEIDLGPLCAEQLPTPAPKAGDSFASCACNLYGQLSAACIVTSRLKVTWAQRRLSRTVDPILSNQKRHSVKTER